MNLRPLLLVAVLAILLAGVTLTVRPFRPASGTKHTTATETLTVPAMVRSLRPTYPYSIIPGGVYSRSELVAQLGRDSVARAHYADFNVSNARLTASNQDRLAYVSYRQHGQVFWTRNKLRIPKGELLLTDGQNLARTRCGNRLAEEKPASARTSATEPVADLQMPSVSEKQLTDERLSFSTPPESGTQMADSTAKPLGWEPLNLPFSWTPKTEVLSATAPPSNVSPGIASPFSLPIAGAPFFRANQVLSATTPVSGTTPAFRQSAHSGGYARHGWHRTPIDVPGARHQPVWRHAGPRCTRRASTGTK